MRKVISFPVFLGAALAAGAFAVTAWDQAPVPGGKIFAEGDTWWHTAVGARILSTGAWPKTDPYSFTVHGNPWIAYEWLGEVCMSLSARLGSLQGMAGLLILLSISFVLLLYYYAWLRSRNPLASAVAVALLLPMEAAAFTLRPQLLGYIFLLVTLICLERFKQGNSKALWVLPGVFVLWVNTHGSFVLGLLIIGLYWSSGLVSFRCGGLVADLWGAKQRRHLLLISLLCVLGLMVTPYGARLAAYPFEFMFAQPDIPTLITEWQPLDFSLPFGMAFLLVVLALAILQVVFPRPYKLEVLTLLVFTAFESCVHGRFLIFFASVSAPVLAAYLADWLPAYDAAHDRYVLNAALIAVMAWGLLAFFPSQARLQEMLGRTFPVRAVEYLRAHPIPGGMFNEDTWGGYLIWSRGPDPKVFIDGRADIYEYGGVLADCVRIIQLDPQTFLLLQKYGIKACLLHRNTPLGILLAASPEWQRVYEDRISTIFARKQ